MIVDESSRFERLESRIADLERQVVCLRFLSVARRSPPPMERGMCFFPAGDSIPSKSVTDLQDRDIYAFGDQPVKFTKNLSGRELKRGESYLGGVVDTKLRHDTVAPNDFFYLEL